MLKSFKEFINENTSVSFDQIYSEYWDELLRFCKNFTKDLDTAQEWCQEAFIKAHKKLDQKKDGSMVAWLKRIAKNTIIDHKRSTKETRRHNTEEVNWETIDKGGEAPQYAEMDMSDIENAISKLDPSYQRIFRMFYQEDMTHEEIAKKLGISIGTSKSQTHRAKKKIKRILGEKELN